MNRLASSALTTQDITTALLTATYTADADREILIHVSASGLAGDGAYTACLTKQVNGSGAVYQSPTIAADLGTAVTTLFLPTTTIAVESGDVVKTYLKGLAADSSVSVLTEVYDASAALTASVTSIANGAITAAAIADDAITASKFDQSTAYPANEAIEAANLDHLMLTPVASGADLTAEVVDGTVLSHILASGDTSDYDPDTYALADLAPTISTILSTVTTNGVVLANDAITAAKIAADAVTELQAGLATSTELAKVPKSDGTATWNDTAKATLQAEATDALNAYDGPTNAELTTALAAADDAVLAAIAALNNLSAAQVWQYVIETLTAEQIMRVALAVLAGKATGGQTTEIAFRDYADTKDRVTMTVDSVGDRSAVTVVAT